MVAVLALLASLLALSAVHAGPVSSRQTGTAISIPHFNPLALLCLIPPLKNILCPAKGSAGLSIKTPLGTAQGAADISGVGRFSVKYASAARWQPSIMATQWELP